MSTTTLELKKRLWLRFSRTHAVLFEVPVDGMKLVSGHEVPSRQSIDAVAIGLWRSTEHLVTGFELKVTRSDLIAELNHPIKARAANTACDSFYLVVPTTALLQGTDRQGDLTGLIPADWGVMVARGDSLTTVRTAANQGRDRLDRRFVAGMLTASLNRVHDPDVAKMPQSSTPRYRRRRRRYVRF